MSYSKEYVIDTGYVDKNRRLSLAKLFLMFQECAEAHAETIVTGRDKTTFAAFSPKHSLHHSKFGYMVFKLANYWNGWTCGHRNRKRVGRRERKFYQL